MDLESKKNSSMGRTIELNDPHYVGCRIQYTRDFLLSLNELDVCKNIPSDFDQSILSDFSDSCYYNVQDRKKFSSNLSSQSFRRNEHRSPPPIRSDSHNHSRGAYGRWDSRSTGRSDKDSDSLSDRDSDPGWLHGNQSYGTLKNSEHDGLLGSGSCMKPQVYSGTSPFPKTHASEAYNIKRNSDLYHPPRTYKAVPHPRRGGNDFYNNETFGSLECKNEDNVQEEQRRRASFELMREEQKALVEKSKSDLLKDVGNFVSSVPSVGHEDLMAQSQGTTPHVLSGFNGVTEQKNFELHNNGEVANNHGLDTVQSSNFSNLFMEEGTRPEDGSSSSRSSYLLSLIIGGERGKHGSSDVKHANEVLPQTHDSQSNEAEILLNSSREDEIPPVLTCEELELSLLSDVGNNQPGEIPSGYEWSVNEQQKPTTINDNASQHLLSLLRGGASPDSENMLFKLEENGDQIHGKEDIANVSTSENSLTLETLFGSAFMKELQGSVGSARIEIIEPIEDTYSGRMKVTGIESGWISNECRGDHSIEKIEMDIVGRDGSRPGFDYHQNAIGSKRDVGYEEVSMNHLSEEEILNSLTNRWDSLVSTMDSSFLSSIHNEKSVFSNSSQMKTKVFPENIYSSTSSLDFQHQMSHGGASSGYSFDVNINAHMKLTPENSIRCNTIPHRLTPNAFNPHFERHNESAFDQSFQQAVLQLQMQQMAISGQCPQLMRGISTSQHLIRGLSSSPNLPPQFIRNTAFGFGHDPGVMHRFHAGLRHPNFGALGNGPGVEFRGGGNPEMMRRMAGGMEVGSGRTPSSSALPGVYGLHLPNAFRYP